MSWVLQAFFFSLQFFKARVVATEAGVQAFLKPPPWRFAWCKWARFSWDKCRYNHLNVLKLSSRAFSTPSPLGCVGWVAGFWPAHWRSLYHKACPCDLILKIWAVAWINEIVQTVPFVLSKMIPKDHVSEAFWQQGMFPLWWVLLGFSEVLEFRGTVWLEWPDWTQTTCRVDSGKGHQFPEWSF